MTAPNIDKATVRDFGREWTLYDQSGLGSVERAKIFDDYFSIFPWDQLSSDSAGFDAGCGSGRWAMLVAPRVGHLCCVDASESALSVARKNLADCGNVTFHECPIDAMPFPDNSMDFGYSLGVLHHLPDPRAGIRACARKLKSGAPLLLYIYYAFDNRPIWYRAVWRASDVLRRIISAAPFAVKSRLTECIAVFVYWPLARMARLGESLGLAVSNWPLAAYRANGFYTMRTDALDRFGTRLENRMTREEIHSAMEEAGLRGIVFSENVPFWCAVGFKR